MSLPRISVIIPCYNYARYVGQAIDSVLSQRYLAAKHEFLPSRGQNHVLLPDSAERGPSRWPPRHSVRGCSRDMMTLISGGPMTYPWHRLEVPCSLRRNAGVLPVQAKDEAPTSPPSAITR